MHTYAIGDIQGCYEPLCRLLDKIRFDDTRDRLWFCGDLVNRGGHSLEVLRLVRSLDAASIVVLGNHDLALLSIRAREPEEQRRANPDLRRVLQAPDADDLLDWLQQRPMMHHDPALGYAMVHAGLAPRWSIAVAMKRAREVERRLRDEGARKLLKRMFGDKPGRWSPRLEGVDRLRVIINVMTRMRFCTPRGEIVFEAKGGPGSQKRGAYPWFEVPGHKQRECPIVCGHWSALGLFQGLGVYGIDTGCVWGGPLTALALEPGALPRVIQVTGNDSPPPWRNE